MKVVNLIIFSPAPRAVIPRFSSKPKLRARYWYDRSARRAYFDHILRHLPPTPSPPSALYRLSYAQVLSCGGRGAIQLFNDSVALAVMDAYPEHHFEPWRFRKSPAGWWAGLAREFSARDAGAEAVVRGYFESLAVEYNLPGFEDWSSFERRKMRRAVTRRIEALGGFSQALAQVYPDHPWKLKSRSPKKSAEVQLGAVLSVLFPQEECLKQVTPRDLKFMIQSGRNQVKAYESLRFDFVLPHLRLAFEFQGHQHYSPTHILAPSTNHPQLHLKPKPSNDQLKKEMCNHNNFTLIDVPYWWKGDSVTITEAVTRHRPDLISQLSAKLVDQG